jgi:hypothetical protein
LNKSRTRDAPTPTNISTKSEPDREKMALALLQQPFANRVFPVPGGPTSKAPLNFTTEVCVFLWVFQKLDNFVFLLAPSSPATSLNVVFTSVFFIKSFAFDFPILKICPLPPPLRLTFFHDKKHQ